MVVFSFLALLALKLDVTTSTSFINFGAFLAFSLVNLSVIFHYWIGAKQRGVRELILFLVFPAIGLLADLWLMVSLDHLAIYLGLVFLYIGLFLVVLLALGAWSLRSFFGFSTNADATVLNGRWTKAVETHYDDQFPIKRIGTNLWAALDYKLFNEGRPGVVLGRDQWLFSDEEFKPWPNAQQNVADNYALVEGVRKTLKEHGVKLVMAVASGRA